MAPDVWTDDPTRSADEDGLGRNAYARRAGDLILETQSFESSVVFGLSGPWGSGKTSMVNMIVEHIANHGQGWVVARFTPWATSDVDSLIAEFYTSLATALPDDEGTQARKALAATARVAAPVARLIPLAGGAVAEAAKMAADALTKDVPWQVAYEKASEELQKLKIPVLVVVDDIDRLHQEELLVLMKVVRLLGRFDGMQYLLAYDDETLYRSIHDAGVSASQDGTPERFMEKIVQYPLIVPPLLRHQQITRLREGLLVVGQSRGRESFERINGLMDCFLTLLTTPRAIDRYIAQLVHHVPLLPVNEVDDDDVYLLTLLRVALPKLHNALHEFRNELITGRTGHFNANDLEHQTFDADVLIGLVPLRHREVARTLLTSLFPKIDDGGNLSAIPSQLRQSVQNEQYFDRYFAMGILDHDMPDVDVAQVLAQAADGDRTALTSLFASAAPAKWQFVLTKAVDLSIPGGNSERLNLATAIADFASQLPTDGEGPFSVVDVTLRWMAEQMVGLDRHVSAEAVSETLDVLGNLTLKIRVWQTVATHIGRVYRNDLPNWFAERHDGLLRETTESVVEHLEMGDTAPINASVGSRITFVLDYEMEPLRSKVLDLHANNRVSLETIASRCVGVVIGRDGGRYLNEEIHQYVYDQIAPLAADGENPWYDFTPAHDVDLSDISWENRRLFARGRVSPPRR